MAEGMGVPNVVKFCRQVAQILIFRTFSKALVFQGLYPLLVSGP